ncbi:MAG: transposase [Symploca sp. SIO1A3]|nr:transposase [Symploca sp. SIO1A3]
MTTTPNPEYDSPWKEALESYFPEFLEFFFPKIYKKIDWQRQWEFLDKELQQVVRDAEVGRRFVDKLVKVWRRNGQQTWVLLHVEIQGSKESVFPNRMYVYHYRLSDRYNHPIVSLAVLTDENPNWKPTTHNYSLWGCKLKFKFPIAKLLDYKGKLEQLEQSKNPFAVVTLAHLQAQATSQTPETRLEWKLRLVKGLYNRGYSKKDILELFRFIDWVLALPEDLKLVFKQELHAFEENKQMRYVTSIEQMGIKQGLQQGLQQGNIQQGQIDIIEVLEVRFGEVSDTISQQIYAIQDPAMLKTLLRQAITIESLAEFQQAIALGTST